MVAVGAEVLVDGGDDSARIRGGAERGHEEPGGRHDHRVRQLLIQPNELGDLEEVSVGRHRLGLVAVRVRDP